uniref:Auxin-responsive protein n=1 Tax=Triticum urartu TaxID=4572 RepID=A0A8R7JY41_TRIUA
MSVETERSSTESSAASGLDFEDTALTLRLPGSDPDRKRASTSDPDCPSPTAAASDSPPSPKAQVVGWPPVRSFRKNALAAAASSKTKFVKVAVDGAPYLRKVDLKAYAGYTSSASYDQLLATLQDKFISHLTVRKLGNEEMKLVDAVSGTEYVPTYEDKDGDWMLVGDVPWRMFVETCQRIRLMKSSEVVNLGTHNSSDLVFQTSGTYCFCCRSTQYYWINLTALFYLQHQELVGEAQSLLLFLQTASEEEMSLLSEVLPQVSEREMCTAISTFCPARY